MRRAVRTSFGSLTSYNYGVDSYDSTKLGLGQAMIQTSGVGAGNNWVGPMPISVIRPFEYTTAVPGFLPQALQWSNNSTSKIDWIFLADNAAAAATRRIVMATYNRLTSNFSITGVITLTYPAATNHTIRGFRMTYDKHTAGTVGVSGTAVTGTSTTWQTDGACVGNRIGFGSTDPTAITTWYEISAIGSDTSITLTTTAGTISSGTAYVIEDLRAVTSTTNATATNGGLFVAKGLRPEIFIASSTTIPAATTTDNIRAVYWLKDAPTVTNTVSLGLAIEPVTSKASHTAWALDTTSNPVFFKYNLRAALAGLASGASTSAFVLKTGSGGALSGTASQVGNGTYAVASHGPGSGIGCIYFTTTTKVYRSAQTSTIASASTTFLADTMSEIPPGSTTTYAASSLMTSIEYVPGVDKFAISVNATTTPFRDYLTQYRTDAGQLDRVTFGNLQQLNQSTTDATTAFRPDKPLVALTVAPLAGLVYVSQNGTAATNAVTFVTPLAADWEYAATTKSRVLTPAISISNPNKFAEVLVSNVEVLGGTSTTNLGTTTEAWRLYYRTTGITDDSGSWTSVPVDGSISGISGTTTIQLMFEFKTIGTTFLPARICSATVTWDDVSTDSHYQLSVGKSDLTNKRFAWRFATAFGSTVPPLRVQLYDAVSGGLLVDDNTSSPTGTFERSTDGSSWSSWNNTDKGNNTTYIRYTPASLADNTNVQAVLMLL